MTLFNLLQGVGGDLEQSGALLPDYGWGANALPAATGPPGAWGPSPPSPAPTASAAAAPALPAALQAHVDFVALQTSAFDQALARASATRPVQPAAGPPPGLNGLPAPPQGPVPPADPGPPVDLVQALDRIWNASLVRGTRPGPATVANLSANLVPIEQWIAQALEQARASADNSSGAPGQPPEQIALTTQLAALGGISAGMRTAAAGYVTGTLSPAQASDVFRLAYNTVLTIVNSLRIAVQVQTLETYGVPLVPVTPEAQAGGDLAPGLAGPGPTAVPGTAQAASNVTAATKAACCEVADLMGQMQIQRIQGTSSAINVAAYAMAFQAALERMGADAAAAANTTAPARALLAGIDVVPATLAAPGGAVLVPVPGAFPAEGYAGAGIALDPAVGAGPDQALASRCGAVQCNLPVTAKRLANVQQNLAASIANLVGYSLYVVSVQLSMAVEPGAGSRMMIPEAYPGQPMAWSEPLLQQFRGQVREALPEPLIASLLGTVPGPSAAEAAAFPGVTPGMAGAEVLPTVLQVLTQDILDNHWQTLVGLDASSPLPSSTLAGMLSDLYRLSAAGLEQRGLAGNVPPAVQQPEWPFLANVTELTRYALAASNGYRTGALDPRASLTLLGDILDIFQALFYGWAIETSAVPLEVSLLYQGGIIAPLARARAQALGLEASPGAAEQRCLDACNLYRREYQAIASTITANATQAYLAAYIEGVTGAGMAEVEDIVDLIPAPAGNRTGHPTRTPGRRLLQADSPTSAPVRALAPAARSILAALYGGMPTPAPQLDAACPDGACDLSFSRQLIALAQQAQNAARLTLVNYSINLVVRSLRIAMDAEAARLAGPGPTAQPSGG
jgi:hypothetical protein